MQNPECLFVAVNYFNELEVVQFVSREITKQNCDAWLIAIVNNGCKHPEVFEELKNTKVQIMHPIENTGYLGAAGFALKRFQEMYNCLPKLLVLSNTDMHYEDPKMLKYWLENYSNQDQIGMVGCRIKSTLTGVQQNPMYIHRMSKRKLQNLNFIFSNRIAYTIYRSASLVKSKISSVTAYDSEPQNKVEVYAIHGSCMVLHQQLFRDRALFEDAPFLFGEEIYLAEVCYQKKLKVIFDPKQQILHDEHQTTGIYKSKIQRTRMKDSLTLILNKFYS